MCVAAYSAPAPDGLRTDKATFFQAEDGIRDRSPSRGLGDVYKRQLLSLLLASAAFSEPVKQSHVKQHGDLKIFYSAFDLSLIHI